MFGEKDFVLSAKPSHKEIVGHINSIFKEHWYRDFSYIKQRPKHMKSNVVPKQLLNRDMLPVLKYMEFVTNNMYGSGYVQEKNLQLSKEFQKWDFDGAYCMYVSILFYGIVTKYGLIDKKDISYYQGYYDYESNNMLAMLIPAFQRQMGIHAWLCVNDSVIDLTFNQNANSFGGNIESNMIIGKYDNAYKLVGYKETSNTIQWYMNKFSSFLDMSVDEWLEYHYNNALKGDL